MTDSELYFLMDTGTRMDCDIKGEQCSFRCTGYVGGKVWRDMESAIDRIDCEECRDHGGQLLSGIHDVVNVGLGKPAFNKSNFRKFVSEVNCVYDKCLKDGRC